MDWIKLTDEFNSIIYNINHTDNNYFITGRAGTGKSTLLKYLNATLDKRCVLLAPTGRAAINIGGQTLHSFFYLDSAVIQPKDYKNKKIKKLKKIDIVIIDEISMVRADVLDSINEIMKNTCKNDSFSRIPAIYSPAGDIFINRISLFNNFIAKSHMFYVFVNCSLINFPHMTP